MKYYEIDNHTTLSQLIDEVGSRNVDNILHINGLDRSPDIGSKFTSLCGDSIVNLTDEVSWQRKYTILNKFAGDSDLFEKAANAGGSEWKLLSSNDTFVNLLKIPQGVELPDSYKSWGNGEAVDAVLYNRVMGGLKSEKSYHSIDFSAFNEYSSRNPSNLDNTNGVAHGTDVFRWFKIPWGEVTLYSNLSDEHVDFPVYPEEMNDAFKANYTTMPDLIYQYEPWQIYTGSGPRTNTYSFDFHRDMWTGDHRDGLANNLIRFCQACCYAQYKGSAVNTPIVTLYIHGDNLITGVLTDVNVEWSGPLGLDGFYLHVKLTLTITEVSKNVLTYESVRKKSIIG